MTPYPAYPDPAPLPRPVARRPERRYPRRGPKPDETPATVAVILGGVGVVLFCIWPLSGLLALAGLVFGVAGLRTPGRKRAVVGLVLSSVTLVYAAGLAAITVAAMATKQPPTATPGPPPFFPPPIGR